MSGRQKDSLPESQSTGTPGELETPQPLTGWADELAQFLPQQGVEAVEPCPSPEPEAEPQPQVTTLTPQDLNAPMMTVVENGKEIVRPDVIKTVVELGSLGQLVKIRKALERDHIQGKQDPRDLEATEEPQHVNLVDDWPNTPWATAYFFNRGPNSVSLAINKARPFVELRPGEDQELDFTKADSRIWFIEYECASGETASLKATGKY